MLTTSFLPTLFRSTPRTASSFPSLGFGFPEFDEVAKAFFGGGECPVLNARTDDEETVVTAELPGFDPEEIDLSVEGSTLTITGSREAAEAKEGEAYHRRERWSGKFTRSLKLPADVDAAKVEAGFKDGVLTIKLPKSEEHKPKKIAVRAA
jgi:HSP20 family protein